MRRITDFAIVAVVAMIAGATPAFAGMCVPGAPAPVIGLGIPALAAFGLAYKRLRNRGEK